MAYWRACGGNHHPDRGRGRYQNRNRGGQHNFFHSSNRPSYPPYEYDGYESSFHRRPYNRGYNNNNYNNNYNNYNNNNNNFNNRGTHLNSYESPHRGIMNNNRQSSTMPPPPPPPPHHPLPPKKATTAAVPAGALEKISSVNKPDVSPPKEAAAAIPGARQPWSQEEVEKVQQQVKKQWDKMGDNLIKHTPKDSATMIEGGKPFYQPSSRPSSQQPSRLSTDDPASNQGLPGAPSVPDMPTEATSQGGMTLVGRPNQAAGIDARNGNQLVSISCLSILYLKCLCTNIIFAYEHTSYRTTCKLAVSVPTTSSHTTLTALTMPS